MPQLSDHVADLQRGFALRDGAVTKMRSTDPGALLNPATPNMLSGMIKPLFPQGSNDATGTDLGLSDLIGLGSTAPTSVAGTQVSSGVEEYDNTVEASRVQAVADLYYLYMHERAGVFQAVAKLNELFKAGSLRLADGPGAFGLYRFDHRTVLRYPMAERLRVYKRLFGYGPAAASNDARPNQEFHAGFTLFISETAKYWRDRRISNVINQGAPDPTFGSVAVVRRSALDLRNNLKNASFGNVNVLRIELSQMLQECFAILNAPDVRNQFGSTSAWDTLELVLWQYFQRAVPTSAMSRLASSGRELLNWVGLNYMLAPDQSSFEIQLQPIAVPAEEWLASNEAVRATVPTPPARQVYRPGPPPRLGTGIDPVFGRAPGRTPATVR